MYIYQIRNILDAIRDYVEGDIGLLELSQTLKMPYPRLETLFLSAGIIGLNANIQPESEYQDAVNVIMLYYAMSKSVYFKTLQFTEKVEPPYQG